MIFLMLFLFVVVIGVLLLLVGLAEKAMIALFSLLLLV
jgi:hypothetical protein